MGKRGGTKKKLQTQNRPQARTPVSLREEATGKKQPKGGVRGRGRSSDAKSLLKLDHLKDLALWSSREASIPSLAAFFGTCLASTAESMSGPPDPSLFPCQKCETILQPGFNCTIRIEKKISKPRHSSRQKKPTNSPQNNVVYTCHFCSYRNLKRGTSKGTMKAICPTKKDQTRKPSRPEKGIAMESKSAKEEKEEEEEEMGPANGSETPLLRTGSTTTTTTLLEGKRRKRNRSGSRKQSELPDQSVGRSKKRRRKSWTSLKEIVESSEHGGCSSSRRNINTFPIPFIL